MMSHDLDSVRVEAGGWYRSIGYQAAVQFEHEAD
jgi:hypothetical protein